ncbi:MAG: amidase family protein [Bacteroidota bacterium]
MKKNYSGFTLLLISAIVFFITCQSPLSKQVKKESDNVWIEELTITQIQQGYKEHKFTIKEVVNIYLTRIREIDKNGPQLNSIIEINPDAIQIAEELDRELAAGKSRGPMHGVPVILKDNIDTHDKMPTTAGATALRNSFPKTDSYVAKKLRDAGAIIIAKSNLSEWANFRAMMASKEKRLVC